jgi:cyanate permease
VTPMILGALADITGSFTLSLWTMVGAAVVMLLGTRSTAYLRMRPIARSVSGPPSSAIPGPPAG